MSQLNEQTVQEIFDNLTLNIKLSQELLAILAKESEALQAMDTQELLRVSKQKGALLARIQFLDNALKNHLPVPTSKPKSNVSPTHQGASISSGNDSLSGLIDFLPQERAVAAKQCKETLRQIRQEILVKNYINKKFTEETLGCLGEAIALFTQPVSARNTYSASNLRPPKATSLPRLLSTEV